MKKEKSIHPITNKSKIQPEDLDRKEKLNQFSKPSIFQLIFAQEGTIEKKKKRFRLVFLFPRVFLRQPRLLALIRARCEPALG